MLTLASFVFYGWENPRLLPLLFVSTLVNGLAAQDLLSGGRSQTRRRLVLALALSFNLGALAFFKYAALVGQNFAAVTLPADSGIRIIQPDTMVTQDFSAERINIHVGADGIITSVECY